MVAYLSVWWVWLGVALVLGIAETLIPGFVFLGFAIGAAMTGLALLGPLAYLSTPAILLIFSAVSLGAWLVLRKLFSLPKGQVKRFDHDIND